MRGGNHLTDKEFEKAMDIIATAISDAGYNVREQLTGFLLTGDPTYITRRNDARTLIKSIDQEQLRRYINGLS
ncbi:MAG: IreB family regulatory phosphoprotein, partial [Paraprevotella sp.]|nr:IreB family regulatory phosphoprotein [Paraprevotella sp.]